jgi:hypothetical protein
MPAWPLCISSIYCVTTVGKHLYACLAPVYLTSALMSLLEVSICMPAWPLCIYLDQLFQLSALQRSKSSSEICGAGRGCGSSLWCQLWAFHWCWPATSGTAPFELHSGLFLLPFGSLLGSFSSLSAPFQLPFGSLLGSFSSLSAPFQLPFGSLLGSFSSLSAPL